MEKFEDKIAKNWESHLKSSPIWLWFPKSYDQKNEARCGIGNCAIQCKLGSTTAMTMHLKKCHGSLTKYNAAKNFDELSEVKEERQKFNKQKLSIGYELRKSIKKPHF